MGALHEGHLGLVKRAQNECDISVVSIFVNPTQFGPKEDFNKYPRTERDDLKKLKAIKVNAVFIPRSPSEIYSSSDETQIIPRKYLQEMMEGILRPGHFVGVATVVFKLFQFVNPDRAYFGEKDYQQLKVIEAMVEDLSLRVKVVSCTTYREPSGLAMSSRNRYLSTTKRAAAAQFYEVLKTARSISEAKRRLVKCGFKVQYIESWSTDLKEPKSSGKRRWLAAIVFDGVRLIDNIKKF